MPVSFRFICKDGISLSRRPADTKIGEGLIGVAHPCRSVQIRSIFAAVFEVSAFMIDQE
jgi:hypothetical protein